METTNVLCNDNKVFRSYRTYEEWKQGRVIDTERMTKCSYRTYEEWKPTMSGLESFQNLGSYRTYEEWKRNSTKHNDGKLLRSYRTYEEWKPCNSTKCMGGIRVLTVPMRNGNYYLRSERCFYRIGSYRTYEEWKL